MRDTEFRSILLEPWKNKTNNKKQKEESDYPFFPYANPFCFRKGLFMENFD